MTDLTVQPTADGKFQVTDASGHFVAGPFETNSEAWHFADVRSGESGVPKRKKHQALHGPRRGKRSGKATPSRAKFEGEPSPKQRREMMKEAAKAPGWLREIAAVKFDPAAKRAYRDSKLGKMGAASPVRHIDPAKYLPEKGGA